MMGLKLNATIALYVSFLIVGTHGYAFTTKGAGNAFGLANGNTIDTASTATTNPPPESQPETKTPPIFSGFGHATSSAVTESSPESQSSPPPPPAPVFSGFGHVTNAAPTSSSSQPLAAAPLFSGFGHATTTSVTPPSPVPIDPPKPAPVIFSGFGHALKPNDSSSTTTAATTTASVDDDNSLFDPDLYEASQFLHAARDQVMKLREDLERKAMQQKELVRELRAELQSQEAGYEARLERLADQFQEYKFAAHRDKLQLQETLRLKEEAMQAESALKEQALRMEITKLEQELLKAKEEVNMANEWKVQFTEQFQALQTNFTELRQIYMDDQMEWEDRLEMEQNARQKDRTLAENVLRQAQEEAEAKARRARMEASSRWNP
ncbi:hypothetical protein MHU86_9478 [Fragilaria crotonensis]|nr:hypothetical protein MHU86_9478 [Fragilaria crotonensis]